MNNERAIFWVLTVGMVVSGALLFIGLILENLPTGSTFNLIGWGVMTLILTPISAIVISFVAYLSNKEFRYAAVSLFIILAIILGIFITLMH